MDNEFVIKNKIMQTFETGNIIIDLILGTFICNIITRLINNLNYNNFFNCINLFRLNKNYSSSIFMEYKTNKLSDSFKGILYYIDSQNVKKISNIIENRELKWCSKSDIQNEELIYIPKSNQIYEIKNDIFIEIGNREKKIGIGNNEIYQDLTNLTISTKYKGIDKLKEFIVQCKKDYKAHMKNIILSDQSLFNCIYNDIEKSLYVRKIKFNTNRNFNNLFFDQKDELISKVNKFINGEQWYNSKGIPYTLGILLYGYPGCGKTSFIKALLKYIDQKKKKRIHGIYVNLHDSFDFDELEKIISQERLGDFEIPLDRRLFIFEDIDCMGDVIKDRDIKEKEKFDNKVIENLLRNNDNKQNINIKKDFKKNSLSRLLNILDGIIETPGRIIIMTTNKIDILDKALIRPGRIDIKIKFNKCSKKMIKDIINNFYNINLETNLFNNISEFKISPAELIQKCFTFDSYNNLINHLNTL